MKKIIIPIAAIAIAITACNSDDSLVTNAPETIQERENHFSISIKDALKTAEQTKEEFFGSSTRSASTPDVKIVYANHSTRSQGKAMYYVINYGNDGGFAVVSADSRMGAIHAISDDGNLHLEDTVQNKGLAMFFSQLNRQYAVLPPIDHPGIPLDTTQHEIITPENKITKIEPMLAKSVRKWWQGSPYNALCPQINQISCMIGCVALSAAQILSYHKYPAQIGQYTIDWQIINTSSNNPYSCCLLAELGSSQYFDLSYGLLSTSGKESKVISSFSKLGYRIKNVSYSNEFASLNLSSGPVLIYSIGVNSEKGHAWVVDGSIEKKYEVPDYENGGWIKMYDTYAHCVWGQASRGDGYFKWSESIIGENLHSRDTYDERGTFEKQKNLHIYSGFQTNNN